MNIDYLNSIIDLYLKKENDIKKTILSIKKLDDVIDFSFNMKKDNDDKTTFVIPTDEFNKYLARFLNKYK